MKYIEAPNMDIGIATLDPNTCLFLAGSISNARDWQSDIVKNVDGGKGLLDVYNVFNPRRENYDMSNADIEKEQITWEFHCINKLCSNVLFWFSSETMAPITLFEYGKVLKTHDHSRIFVGIHPDYPRLRDVVIQTKLENPQLAFRIVYDLEHLRKQVIYRSLC
jgi:hypothetical protein